MCSSAVSLFPLLNSRPQYPLARAAGLFTWQNAIWLFPYCPIHPLNFCYLTFGRGNTIIAITG